MQQIQFIEPVFVPDVYVEDVAYTQDLSSGLWRLTFYNSQISPIDCSVEYPIAAKFLVTRQTGLRITRTLLRQWNVPAWVLLG